MMAKAESSPGRLTTSPARTSMVLVIPRTVRPFVGEAPPSPFGAQIDVQQLDFSVEMAALDLKIVGGA